MSANIKIAVDVKLFQLLKDAGEAGLSETALSEKTGIEADLLQRLARHLVAMNVLTFYNGTFHGTKLSDALAAENYQESISFCYEAARPSFNAFPEFFKQYGYKAPPLSSVEGPFQFAHKTELPFFAWLNTTPPFMSYFASFMTAYRAGKANWYDPGFYPVAERLIKGFDTEVSGDAFLVDVGGGRGHDLQLFAAQHPSHPGKLLLQDQEPVIAEVVATGMESKPFEAKAHDFFTPQPVKAARAYSLHSILHDWGDVEGLKILENLKPALKPGYSRVLLNEIVINEEKPNLAGTVMDMMMLAHLNVRERTESQWRAIVEKAGLKVIGIYSYPGVAESVIEAELAE
jgi:hypothetical protein